MTVILVCGGRDFYDKKMLKQTLDKIRETSGITKIVHGGARGADSLANYYANSYGIECKVYPYVEAAGKAGGPIRNKFMLQDANPDLIVAFPGGKGTANMIKLAQNARKKIIIVVGAPPAYD